MEETLSLIFHGCRLVKDLESNLPNLANQPEMLSESIDDIIKFFATAKERLNAHQDLGYSLRREAPQDPLQQLHTDDHQSVQEWLIRYGVTQAMDVIQQRLLAGKSFGIHEMGRKDLEAGPSSRLIAGGEIQAIDVSLTDSGKGSSSSQRQRRSRTKDDEEKCKIKVPAPRMGNTELPPDDGFTWRKYGQKEILGSKFPRAYYRCTHQKMYNCPAKKLVQRLDDDPFTFEVTYRGEHTCHMSATAPSIPPPSQPPQPIDHHQATQETAQARWLSMEFSLGAAGSAGGGGGSTTGGGSTSGAGGRGAGPSTVRYGRDVDYPVTDLADAMFNSGSSSSNSMEFIFPFVEDKWEQGEKKN